MLTIICCIQYNAIGNHTLRFIEETAQMVAVEGAKTAISIMMGGNGVEKG